MERPIRNKALSRYAGGSSKRHGTPCTIEGRRLPPKADYPEGISRPQTRGECRCQERPCPWVSCRYHLYLDVNPETGAIKLNFPHLEVWEMKETCALDVADRKGGTLDSVAIAMNVTRHRVQQMEDGVLMKIRVELERRGWLGEL